MAMMEDIDAEVEELALADLPPEQFVATVADSPNFADLLTSEQAAEIATNAIRDYEIDKESMSDWFEKMQRGIDLAQQVKEEKDYPHSRAANICYPLVTSAALQWNARAYPAIVPSGDVVKVKTQGEDPMGKKAERADRVGAHMSYRLVGMDSEWEEDTDRLLMQMCIVGTMARKVWFDGERERRRTIEPGKFIVHHKVRNIDDAPRCTEELELYPYEIEERIRSGLFAEFEWDDDEGEASEAPHTFIEQHCRLDLDDDDYAEPYIVTVHCETQTLVRIVADFTAEDVDYATETRRVPMPVPPPMAPMQPGAPMLPMQPQFVEQTVNVGIRKISRGSYFVPYTFVPAMDGGFWGIGFGVLLGDLSEAVNAAINMMIDAGHYEALGGGFIGSEIRMKGGSHIQEPGEFKQVPYTGDDIRRAIVERTWPGPSQTMFALLGMLIESGREVASVKDVMTGDMGQRNMTATTTLALIEQGMTVFSAAYKRVFRALRQEFRLYAKILSETISPEEYARFFDVQQAPQGQSQAPGQPPQGSNPLAAIMGAQAAPQAPPDPRRDYDLSDLDILPVADPRAVTDAQKMGKAQLLLQLAEAGIVDRGEAVRRVLEAAGIEDLEPLLPKDDGMKQQVVQMQLQAAQAEMAQKMADLQLTLAKVQSERAKAAKEMSEVGVEAAEARLEEMELMLEAQRDGLQRALARGAGRLAQPPGDGMPARPVGGGAAAAPAPGQGGVLGGPPVAEGSSIGAPGGGSPAGPVIPGTRG